MDDYRLEMRFIRAKGTGHLFSQLLRNLDGAKSRADVGITRLRNKALNAELQGEYARGGAEKFSG